MSPSCVCVVDSTNARRSLSLEYGLKAVYRSEFHEIFADERRDSEFGPLLQRMKVVNARGDSAMTEDQWDAASKSFCSLFGRLGAGSRLPDLRTY